MKIFMNVTKSISVILLIFILSIFLVLFSIGSSYNNFKICRSNSTINIENYRLIDNVLNIDLLDNCDKLKIYVILDESIDKNNINGVILKFVDRKFIYNNDDFIEIIFKNEIINYIVTIDKNEEIDIDIVY